jgi:phosphoribosylanthranilate isomerase
VLFDASCGRGKSPQAWATPFCCGDIAIDTGYAGGISPENIESVLDAAAIAVRGSRIKTHRYWIDMQSGVRTGKQFDLRKVERVLKIVARRFR